MLSGLRAAIVLGVTSAKINTTKVMIIVTAKIPLSPHNLTAINVAITDAKILTKLFPIKITPNNLSVLLRSFETLLADLSLFWTRCLSLYLFKAIMLVSALEKKADRSISITMLTNSIQRGISFNL